MNRYEKKENLYTKCLPVDVCVCLSNLASSSCFSLAFLLAFLPWVLASRALASDSISNSSLDRGTETTQFPYRDKLLDKLLFPTANDTQNSSQK